MDYRFVDEKDFVTQPLPKGREGRDLNISFIVITTTGLQTVLKDTHAHLDYTVHDSLHVQSILHLAYPIPLQTSMLQCSLQEDSE